MITIEILFDLDDSFILTQYLLMLLRLFYKFCLYSNSVNLKI